MEDATLKVNALEQSFAAERGNVPSDWEPEYVGRKLVAAFATLDRLPRVRGPRMPGHHWPQHSVEWADQLAQAELDETEKEARSIRRNCAMLRPSAAKSPAWMPPSNGCGNCAGLIPALLSSPAFGRFIRRAIARFASSASTGNGRRTCSIASAPRPSRI
jgi:hypothetical protein